MRHRVTFKVIKIFHQQVSSGNLCLCKKSMKPTLTALCQRREMVQSINLLCRAMHANEHNVNQHLAIRATKNLIKNFFGDSQFFFFISLMNKRRTFAWDGKKKFPQEQNEEKYRFYYSWQLIMWRFSNICSLSQIDINFHSNGDGEEKEDSVQHALRHIRVFFLCSPLTTMNCVLM